jgi:DNA repair exonuclease SbcCD ATPase subunit
VDVKETAHIVQKTKTDIVALKESVKEDENELLEIIKRIVEKERELEEKKALVSKAKEARKAFVESWKGNSKNADLEKLRTYEEQTQKYRGELKIVRSELKELKTKRYELLSGVESKEMDIDKSINNIEKRINKSR